MPDDILDDLEEARAKIEATRRLLEAQGGEPTQLVDLLQRLEEAVAKAEGALVAGAAEARS